MVIFKNSNKTIAIRDLEGDDGQEISLPNSEWKKIGLCASFATEALRAMQAGFKGNIYMKYLGNEIYGQVHCQLL